MQILTEGGAALLPQALRGVKDSIQDDSNLE